MRSIRCFIAPGFALTVLGALLLAPGTAAAQGSAAADRQVTFTKDVAPILQRSCVSCHRAGEMAPMSLMTYEDARPWARAIKTRVAAPRDAAVAHRPEHRHPVVQGRPVAERRRDRHDRQVGRRRRADAATRPTCRRCVSSPTAPVADRQARYRRQVPGLQGARGRSRSVRQPLRRHSDRPRTATSRRFRPARRPPSVAQSRASCAVVRGRRPDAGDATATTARASTAASSWSSTPPARTPKCTRPTPACCSRPARRRWSAITCIRSAKKSKAESRSASSCIPKGYVPKHIRWSKQLAQPTVGHRHPGRHRGAHRRLHRAAQAGADHRRSSRTCTSAASVSASS